MSSKTTKNKKPQDITKRLSKAAIKVGYIMSKDYYESYIYLLPEKIRFIEAQIIAGVLGTHDHYNKPTRAQWYVLKKKQLEYIRKWLTNKQNLKITEIYMQLMHQGPKRIISQVKIKKQK